MSTQTISVSYDATHGIRFFDSKGQQFNGDLVCPQDGCTFVFVPKIGASGWIFSGLAVTHVAGPDSAQFGWTVQPNQIQLDDPGNGDLPDSFYDYTLTIKTTTGTIETVSIDPKIKNTGGH